MDILEFFLAYSLEGCCNMTYFGIVRRRVGRLKLNVRTRGFFIFAILILILILEALEAMISLIYLKGCDLQMQLVVVVVVVEV